MSEGSPAGKRGRRPSELHFCNQVVVFAAILAQNKKSLGLEYVRALDSCRGSADESASATGG